MKAPNKPTIAVCCFVVACMIAALFTNNGGFDFWASYGIWSLLPMVAVVLLVCSSRMVELGLICGLLVGSYLLALQNINPIQAIVGAFTGTALTMATALTDPSNLTILLTILCSGGLVRLLCALGVIHRLTQFLMQRDPTPVRLQVTTLLLCLLLSYEDHLAKQALAPALRSLYDATSVSRQKFGFLLCVTTMPWAAWFGASIGIEILPYMLYPLLLLCFTLLSALFLRDFGPMHTAELRARAGFLRTASKDGIALTEFALAPLQSPARTSFWWLVSLAVLPIGTAVGLVFFGLDGATSLLFSVLLASAATFLLAVITRQCTLQKSTNAFLHGVLGVARVAFCVLLALSFSGMIGRLGTAAFLTDHLLAGLPVFMIPCMVFLLSVIITMLSGSSFVSLATLMPSVVALSSSLSLDSPTLAVTGAVMAGACFLLPFSSSAIVSANGADCTYSSLLRTTLPYLLVITAITAVFGYVPLGLGLSVWLVLPLCVVMTGCFVLLVGKKIRPTRSMISR